VDDLEPLREIVEKYRGDKSALISIFHEIHEIYGYLDEKIMRELAKQAGYMLSQLYGLATFYTQFRLEPVGEHQIKICHGTACHVRYAQGLIDESERMLGIGPGGTTEDRLFTMETVNCVGTCALAPVVVLDGKYHGHMTPSKMRKLLKQYMKEGGPEEEDED
jgi:NADH-quinone oxidoreductase subunit E